MSRVKAGCVHHRNVSKGEVNMETLWFVNIYEGRQCATCVLVQATLLHINTMIRLIKIKKNRLIIKYWIV